MRVLVATPPLLRRRPTELPMGDPLAAVEARRNGRLVLSRRGGRGRSIDRPQQDPEEGNEHADGKSSDVVAPVPRALLLWGAADVELAHALADILVRRLCNPLALVVTHVGHDAIAICAATLRLREEEGVSRRQRHGGGEVSTGREGSSTSPPK
eukprot:CAMPEP_0176049964 /NCGR_PEP_ID=MMETSP0120_2-20121206/24831_1 /TAXON_ID=160619 /ORGANISM="Kryptoperidinium foliaceum, Strain CCMP 1326" /LENGTH=153 /DNA_ID=CAMNT_0017383395 /DNA_START=242 /DNA_END=703 /DNA_ORIENTATION=-